MKRRFEFRTEEKEAEIVEAAATRAGLLVATWVRQIVLREANKLLNSS